LIVENCRTLFTKDEFRIDSTSIELVGFKWHLQVKTMEKGFLSVYLHAKPPNDFNGNYRIEVDKLAIQIEIKNNFIQLKLKLININIFNFSVVFPF
jgi:hypothetical protein